MKSRNDKLFLYDILESCKRIGEYTGGIEENVFKESRMLQDALVRNIEIIGEAAKNLTTEITDANSDLPWKEIMRMRDKIIHHYFRIDLDVVWQTVTFDIPVLEKRVAEIYEGLEDN
ncbi:MAG: DUF86 domain-containing protein [Acidobacteria bacterium]|nr:DUF86 domain-containing protein [Acidobacteriota bacterium]